MAEPVYLQATLHVRQGKMGLFNATLKEMTPALEAEGWTLLGAYVNAIGRLNTVVDLWQIPDANSVQSTLGAVAKHPDMRRWAEALAEAVEEETIQLMVKTPYSP